MARQWLMMTKMVVVVVVVGSELQVLMTVTVIKRHEHFDQCWDHQWGEELQ